MTGAPTSYFERRELKALEQGQGALTKAISSNYAKAILKSQFLFESVCERYFKKFDVDKSNGLDYEELVAFAAAIAEQMSLPPPSATQVKAQMDEYDRDHNGIVDSQEFVEFVRSVFNKHSLQTGPVFNETSNDLDCEQLAPLPSLPKEHTERGGYKQSISEPPQTASPTHTMKAGRMSLQFHPRSRDVPTQGSPDETHFAVGNKTGAKTVQLQRRSRHVPTQGSPDTRQAISPHYATALLESQTLFQALIEQSFCDFDKDHNGELDHDELQLALIDIASRTFSLDTSFISADEVLQNYDANANGRLDVEEFSSLLKSILRSLQSSKRSVQ